MDSQDTVFIEARNQINRLRAEIKDLEARIRVLDALEDLSTPQVDTQSFATQLGTRYKLECRLRIAETLKDALGAFVAQEEESSLSWSFRHYDGLGPEESLRLLETVTAAMDTIGAPRESEVSELALLDAIGVTSKEELMGMFLSAFPSIVGQLQKKSRKAELAVFNALFSITKNWERLAPQWFPGRFRTPSKEET